MEGGNFGIATAFEVDLHPAGMVLAGTVFYEASEAERILQDYARHAMAAPDELSTHALLIAAPPAPFIPTDKQGTPVVAIRVCYTGDLAEGERVVAPLRQLATPIADLVAPIPYSAIFASTGVGEIRELQHHVRSQFFETLSDEMLHALVEAAQAIMSPPDADATARPGWGDGPSSERGDSVCTSRQTSGSGGHQFRPTIR